MSLIIKTCFIFALICLLSGTISCSELRQSGSSGAGPATQTCPTGYYCSTDSQCKSPRSTRCTPAQQPCTALDQVTNLNTATSCNYVAGRGYEIRVGHAKLGISGSKKTLLEHRFVIYRGFTYEFGGSYNTQVLDIADPQYKYLNGRSLNSNGITSDGFSSCSYSQAQLFVTAWTGRYNVFTNNCQHFADAMVRFLQGGCDQSSLPRQNTNNTSAILNEINGILSNCSLVCCSSSAAGTGPSPSVYFAGLTFILAFVLF